MTTSTICTIDKRTEHFFNVTTISIGLQLEERRAAVLGALEDFFPSSVDDIQACIAYEEKNWRLENYNGGCPNAVIPPGASCFMEHCYQPEGHLHFAGTETATQWAGYMDGAVQSGQRSAIGEPVVWRKYLEMLDLEINKSVSNLKSGRQKMYSFMYKMTLKTRYIFAKE